jgi:hypothetical protein
MPDSAVVLLGLHSEQHTDDLEAPSVLHIVVSTASYAWPLAIACALHSIPCPLLAIVWTPSAKFALL